MSGESVVVDGRRSRAEIERLAGLYRASGMGRREFCRSHGLALSTLNRHLKKQQNRQNPTGSNGVEQRHLVAVELAGPLATVSVDESPETVAKGPASSTATRCLCSTPLLPVGFCRFCCFFRWRFSVLSARP